MSLMALEDCVASVEKEGDSLNATAVRPHQKRHRAGEERKAKV